MERYKQTTCAGALYRIGEWSDSGVIFAANRCYAMSCSPSTKKEKITESGGFVGNKKSFSITLQGKMKKLTSKKV